MTSKNKSKGFERFSLQFEIAGIFILIVASFWQVKMSGRLEASFVEWQSQIQHEVNLSVLSAISDIASLSEHQDDPALIKKIASSTSEKANKAYFRVSEMTNQREKELGGQVEWFSNVSLSLVLLGTFLTLSGRISSFLAHKTAQE
jgi:hypothetical protein